MPRNRKSKPSGGGEPQEQQPNAAPEVTAPSAEVADSPDLGELYAPGAMVGASADGEVKLSRRQQRQLQKAQKVSASATPGSATPAASTATPSPATAQASASRPGTGATTTPAANSSAAASPAELLKRAEQAALPRGPFFAPLPGVQRWLKQQASAAPATSVPFPLTVPRSFTAESQTVQSRLPANVVRGIQNSANACYVAGVMQAVAHCPPLASALAFSSVVSRGRSKLSAFPSAPGGTGVAAALGDWILQYWASMAPAPLPTPKCFSSSAATRGSAAVALGGGAIANGLRQEDAGEFLQAVLRAVEADMAALDIVAAAPNGQPAAGGATGANASTDKGWVTVGRGSQKLQVRTDGDGGAAGAGGLSGALASSVFNGSLRVMTKNAKGTARGVTSVVLEPFTVLAVPVSAENRAQPGAPPTVADCIAKALAKEAVDGEDRVIRRDMAFGRLPAVLVVQLSRWAVTREGDVVKLGNRVQLTGGRLAPPRELLPSGTSGAAEYRLLSAVCHRGELPTSGHYVTYVVGGTSVSAPAADYATVAVANDNRVTVQPQSAGLAAAEDDSPYLLFYALGGGGGSGPKR